MSQARNHNQRDPRRTAGLVGVIALLLAAVVFYVAYHAMQGLPGQSRYTVFVDVPNASHLNRADEVRIAGLRVGQVGSVDAVTPDGKLPYAHVKLQLDKDVAPLTATDRASVQTGSVLGASFVELKLGSRGRDIPDGGLLPLDRAGSTTQLTDLLDVFDRATARHVQGTLREASTGLAGRGPALNAAIGSFADLLVPFGRVARTLTAPDTRLGDLMDAVDRASAALTISSPQLASLVTNGARTFTALADERRALGATITATPRAEAAATTALLHVQPGLDATARVLEDLRPAAPLLSSTLRTADRALTTGTTALRALPAFARPLQGALRDTRKLTAATSTGGAVRKATELFTSNAPLFDALQAMQATCNSLAIWAKGFSSVFGDIGTGDGPAVAHVQVTTLGASGETLQSAEPAPDLANNQYAHNNDQECESGNEPFTGAQQRTNPPGLQPKKTLDTAPPTGALSHAKSAGLLDGEPG